MTITKIRIPNKIFHNIIHLPLKDVSGLKEQIKLKTQKMFLIMSLLAKI